MSADTVVFICSACRYKARIPRQYLGATIRCPGCQSNQVAVEAPPAPSTGNTVLIQRIASTPVPFTLPADQEAALAAAGGPVDPPIARPATGSHVRGGTPPVARPATGSFTRGPGPVARPASGTYTPSASPSAPPVARPATGSHVRGGSPPVAKPATGSFARTPSGAVVMPVAASAAQGEPAGIEFACPACAVRVRIPGHYLGKSILCPRCSTPQKVVDASGPVRPMDTTRALRGVREVPERGDQPAVVETRSRPDTTDIVPQQATVLPGQALEPEPNTAHAAGDSALTRSDGAKRPSGLVPPPPPNASDETAPLPPGAGSPRRSGSAGRTAVPPPAAPVPLPPPLPQSRGPLLAAGGAAVLLLLGLVAMVVLWRAAESRLAEQRDQLELLRAERARAQSDRLKLEEMMAQLQRSLSATATAAGLPAPLPGASEAAAQAPATAAALGEPAVPEPALPATAPLQ
ncbi:MAG: hypothetical protein L6R48_17080 [Planctomycetes bacterium]|nr:hypothetical protein [Planctomycetota bacterium]